MVLVAAADDDGGRSARDAGHVVMLGQPEAMVAEPFDMHRQRGGMLQRERRIATFDDRAKVEY
jgi:hypothetical protein